MIVFFKSSSSSWVLGKTSIKGSTTSSPLMPYVFLAFIKESTLSIWGSSLSSALWKPSSLSRNSKSNMLFVLTATISCSSRPNWSLKRSYSIRIGSDLCKKPSVEVSIFNVDSCVPRAPTNRRTISIIFIEFSYSQSEKTSNFFSVLDLQFILFLYG